MSEETNIIPVKAGLEFLTGFFALLKPSADGQDRKNLRMAKRTFKQLKKDWGKDGLDDNEKQLLSAMKASIAQRTMDLGS